MIDETAAGNNGAAAHALARICLGINIFLHGLTRIPHFAAFSEKLQHQFANTFLPEPLVQLCAYFIVGGETVIGALILVGVELRAALVAGMVLMILLQFGTALVQDWNAAGLQLIYVAFYALLLATLPYDSFSLDSWRARRKFLTTDATSV